MRLGGVIFNKVVNSNCRNDAVVVQLREHSSFSWAGDDNEIYYIIPKWDKLKGKNGTFYTMGNIFLKRLASTCPLKDKWNIKQGKALYVMQSSSFDWWSFPKWLCPVPEASQSANLIKHLFKTLDRCVRALSKQQSFGRMVFIHLAHCVFQCAHYAWHTSFHALSTICTTSSQVGLYSAFHK